MNNHDVTVRLTSNISRHGAQQTTSQRVNTTVTNHQQVSATVGDQGHQSLNRGARAHLGLNLGSADGLCGLLSSSQVLLSRIITEDLNRILAQSLGGILCGLVVSAADNQGRVESSGNRGSALYCEQRLLRTIRADNNGLVITHENYPSLWKLH